ncbi:YrdB family protein [Demequina sp.]|uniref:YrdB family protein n=1 Tax=Demequina sp. TaxID=2050685 RepID=UPI003D117FAC
MKWLGGTLVFLAELAMYAGMFWWGYTSFPHFWGWLVGLGVPFFVSVFWSLTLSPKAPRPLPTPAKVITRLVLLLAGATAWWLADVRWAAIATAASALVGTALAAKYPIDVPGRAQPQGMDTEDPTLPRA